MRISIVDYGMGNIGSLLNMVQKVGGEAEVIRTPDEILHAGKIILPGVGHFDNATERLHANGMWEALDAKARAGDAPFLCICLGAQLVTDGSEEGSTPGFGWIPGFTRRFAFPQEEKRPIPHMGWNDIRIEKDSPVLRDLPDDPCFYFVHSFYMSAEDRSDVLATTSYGIEFASALSRGNVFALQFHPEKSHKYGMKVVRNFIEMAPC